MTLCCPLLAQPVNELLRLCAKFVGCSVVADDVVRTPGFFLDRQLRRKPGLGFRTRHPPCRNHPLDLGLAGAGDATYYIKIFLPVCFKKKRDDGNLQYRVFNAEARNRPLWVVATRGVATKPSGASAERRRGGWFRKLGLRPRPRKRLCFSASLRLCVKTILRQG